MSIFKASKVVPAAVADLSTVAQALAEHFSALDYEVTSEQADPQCWEIGIHKGGTFQAIIGMKTALRIRIQSVEGGTQIEAGIGFLESQGISTAVSMLAFWPVLVTQTWGLVRQSKLDEEAIAVAEAALLAQAHAGAARYCHECGAAITRAAAFCHACGARLTL
jgi:hypothetical protein